MDGAYREGDCRAYASARNDEDIAAYHHLVGEGDEDDRGPKMAIEEIYRPAGHEQEAA